MLKVLVGMSLSLFFMGLFGVDWQTVDGKIARAFPAVEFVSSESLLAEALLRVAPTIIDVRLPEEYDVRHIPRAHNLQSAEAIAAAFPDYADPFLSCTAPWDTGRRLWPKSWFLWAIRASRIPGIRFSNGQSAVMAWKTPPAARQKSIPTTEPWGALFPKSFMRIRLIGSAAGKLFPPGLRLILHKPVSSDA